MEEDARGLSALRLTSCDSQGSTYEVYADNFGRQTIGNFGSFVYLVNQIFGPGILAVPLVFVKSGFLVCSFVNILVCFTACFAANRLIDAVSMMPDNENLQNRAEYADAVKHFLGPRAAVFFRVLLHLTLQSMNIASIIDTALAFDKLLALARGSTVALEVYPELSLGHHKIHWIRELYEPDDGNTTFAVTAGYLFVLVVCVPMGYFNIDDNITVQIVSFVFLTVLMFEFAGQCILDISRPEPPHPIFPPLVGNDFTQLLSVFVMSYSFGMLIMPWANEAKREVRKSWWVWVSGGTSCVGYGLIGTLLATAFPRISSDNILSRILDRKGTLQLTRMAAYAFAGTIILPGIPVFCISTRYDLVGGGICGPRAALFWGNLAPWLVAWAMSSSGLFANMLTWTSLIAGSLVNFVLPLVLFRAAVRAPETSAHCSTGGMGKQVYFIDAMIAVVSVVLIVAIGYQFS
eukprot:TRINITY_DN87248_c0_g1_i1.p1 TRINITY_DN87248_c0_g1~~TRINITY_DN87248_c0_g1_i1.p1  ORF type:complete len:462 (-),score=36.83 TRINITY_DN87248_c0_g1_i1:2-1387(-)